MKISDLTLIGINKRMSIGGRWEKRRIHTPLRSASVSSFTSYLRDLITKIKPFRWNTTREREREESKGRDREANGFNEKWLIYIYRFRFRVAQYHSALNWVLPAKEHHSTPQIIFHPDLFRRATYTFFIVIIVFSISLTFNLFDDVYEGRKNIDVEIMKRTNEWTNEFPFLIYNFREKFHGKNW